MSVKKLAELQQIMKDRYKTLGFDPGLNPRFAYAVGQDDFNSAQGKKGGSGVAHAGNKAPQQMTAQDLEALDWASKNPADKRSAAILADLKRKGFIKQ
jgi:hypothetical protein